MAPSFPSPRLGTSSWSSDDWKKAGFYPPSMASRDYLPHYAGRYDTVEVDSTFYRSPSAWVCRKWVNDTPDDFRFSLKVPRSVTHDKVLEGAEPEYAAFLEAASELGPKLQHVLLQFGYFNRNSACPDLQAFLGRLERFWDGCAKGPKVAVEIRNRKWVVPELLDALRERGIGLALADQEWMPGPAELWKNHGDRLLTADFAYVRLLGERKRIEAMTDSWDRLVIDRTAETRAWFPLVDAFLEKGVPVWVYFNNHFAGHAPASLELFRRLWLERRGITGPGPA